MIRSIPLRAFLALTLGPLAAGGTGAGMSVDEREPLAPVFPPALATARVLGPADPATPMARMVLVLRTSPEARSRLDTFLAGLQEPGSASFHQWLTPAQFGERFGPSQADLEQVTGWLRDQGFTIDEVAQGRMSVTFSGSAGLVRRALGAPIFTYDVNGSVRRASPLAPTLPRPLASRVEGLLSLSDVPRTALNTGFRPVPRDPGLTVLGMHFLTPGDFATIYNTRPLLTRGIDGSGVAVAIVGRSHPSEVDARTFRWLYGLKPNPPALVIHGPDPGDQDASENGEANLDVEWAGAVAPGAAIKLVVAKSTAATDGVDLAAQYVVDRNLAAVMSVSFGASESSLGPAGAAFYRNLWAQAAAQGITVVVASGDSGAACESPGAWKGQAAAVSALASTPSNVAVGGTQFAKGSGSHWGGFWKQRHGASALEYVPEDAWNESGQLLLGLGLWATGGGPSALNSKPAWQHAPGVPADGFRDTPDLALAAGIANGYLIQTGGLPSLVGGTSCGAPAFAGIMALLVQRTGQRQGNPNPALYRLATAQYASGSPARPFHDILTGDNSVPGVTGFHCGPGYDLATGLGSVDATALVDAWPASSPGGELPSGR